MSMLRCVALMSVAGFAIERAGAAELRADGDVGFVCGVTNPEDLVLVPGTSWIVSSGMAEGAGFYLVDSKAGTAALLPFTAQHDADVRELSDAADAAVAEHARLERPRERARPREALRRGARCARSDRGVRRRCDGRPADVDVARLRADARRPRGE